MTNPPSQEISTHSFLGSRHAAKRAAYKAIIHPTLEYAAAIWNPHNLGNHSRSMLLNRSVVVTAAGIHHPIFGPFPRMTVALNFIFLLSNQEEISSHFVSLMAYTTNKHLSNLVLTAHLIQ